MKSATISWAGSFQWNEAIVSNIETLQFVDFVDSCCRRWFYRGRVGKVANTLSSYRCGFEARYGRMWDRPSSICCWFGFFFFLFFFFCFFCFFSGISRLLPHLTIDSAQNERNNIKKKSTCWLRIVCLMASWQGKLCFTLVYTRMMADDVCSIFYLFPIGCRECAVEFIFIIFWS